MVALDPYALVRGARSSASGAAPVRVVSSKTVIHIDLPPTTEAGTRDERGVSPPVFRSSAESTLIEPGTTERLVLAKRRFALCPVACVLSEPATPQTSTERRHTTGESPTRHGRVSSEPDDRAQPPRHSLTTTHDETGASL